MTRWWLRQLRSANVGRGRTRGCPTPATRSYVLGAILVAFAHDHR